MGRLANLRAISERSIQRHLTYLEHAGLLTRQAQPGRANLLIIEEPSADHADQYLRDFGFDPDPDGTEQSGGVDDHSETPDKSVTPPVTRMSPLQEVKEEESKKNVEQALVEHRRGEGSATTHIGTTLRRRAMQLKAKRTCAADQRAEVLADELCDALADPHSRTFYRSLARTVPVGRLYVTLGQVKEAWREGRILDSRGAMFTALIRRAGEQAGR